MPAVGTSPVITPHPQVALNGIKAETFDDVDSIYKLISDNGSNNGTINNKKLQTFVEKYASKISITVDAKTGKITIHFNLPLSLLDTCKAPEDTTSFGTVHNYLKDQAKSDKLAEIINSLGQGTTLKAVLINGQIEITNTAATATTTSPTNQAANNANPVNPQQNQSSSTQPTTPSIDKPIQITEHEEDVDTKPTSDKDEEPPVTMETTIAKTETDEIQEVTDDADSSSQKAATLNSKGLYPNSASTQKMNSKEASTPALYPNSASKAASGGFAYQPTTFKELRKQASSKLQFGSDKKDDAGLIDRRQTKATDINKGFTPAHYDNDIGTLVKTETSATSSDATHDSSSPKPTFWNNIGNTFTSLGSGIKKAFSNLFQKKSESLIIQDEKLNGFKIAFGRFKSDVLHFKDKIFSISVFNRSKTKKDTEITTSPNDSNMILNNSTDTEIPISVNDSKSNFDENGSELLDKLKRISELNASTQKMEDEIARSLEIGSDETPVVSTSENNDSKEKEDFDKTVEEALRKAGVQGEGWRNF